MKRTVFDLMKQKDLSQIPLIESTANYEEALKKLETTDSGALLVVAENSVVGVFSERDFVRAYSSRKHSLNPDTKIEALMSHKVIFVPPDYRLDECMSVMVKMRVRHLAVLKDEIPIAFLSMRHIMEALVEENQFMVNQLVTYITGSSPLEQSSHRDGLARIKVKVNAVLDQGA
jgi:CBS domain-containing protein